MAGINMVTGVLLARALGPEARGELAVAMLWPTCFQMVVAFGIPQAITYFAGQHRDNPRGVASAALGLGLAQGVMLAAAGWLLLPLVLQSQPESVLAMSRIYILATAIEFLGGYASFVLLGMARLRFWNALRASASCFYLVGLLLLLQAGALDGQNVVRVLLISSVVQVLVQLLFVTRTIGLNHQLDVGLVRGVLATGGRSWLGEIAFLLRGH
jgi:O-antigen/teichoic acid export membrane protein